MPNVVKRPREEEDENVARDERAQDAPELTSQILSRLQACGLPTEGVRVDDIDVNMASTIVRFKLHITLTTVTDSAPVAYQTKASAPIEVDVSGSITSVGELKGRERINAGLDAARNAPAKLRAAIAEVRDNAAVLKNKLTQHMDAFARAFDAAAAVCAAAEVEEAAEADAEAKADADITDADAEVSEADQEISEADQEVDEADQEVDEVREVIAIDCTESSDDDGAMHDEHDAQVPEWHESVINGQTVIVIVDETDDAAEAEADADAEEEAQAVVVQDGADTGAVMQESYEAGVSAAMQQPLPAAAAPRTYNDVVDLLTPGHGDSLKLGGLRLNARRAFFATVALADRMFIEWHNMKLLFKHDHKRVLRSLDRLVADIKACIAMVPESPNVITDSVIETLSPPVSKAYFKVMEQAVEEEESGSEGSGSDAPEDSEVPNEEDAAFIDGDGLDRRVVAAFMHAWDQVRAAAEARGIDMLPASVYAQVAAAASSADLNQAFLAALDANEAQAKDVHRRMIEALQATPALPAMEAILSLPAP